MNESERTAIGIYAVMARDPLDALDMIAECEDGGALDALEKMISRDHERPGTDNELNALFRNPVAERIAALKTPAGDTLVEPGGSADARTASTAIDAIGRPRAE
jgi:hypothetical protein